MSKKINIVGKSLERIEVKGASLPRVEPAEFAAAIGAEPCGEPHSKRLDLISLGELGNELIRRLRSTGGRPSLEGATEQCKVPLRPEDMAALEEITNAIQQKTDTKPSLGQIASVILRLHLDLLKGRSATVHDELEKLPPDEGKSSKDEAEQGLSISAVTDLVEEQLKPVWEELNRMKKELSGRQAE
jgi:hypothetical protein